MLHDCKPDIFLTRVLLIPPLSKLKLGTVWKYLARVTCIWELHKMSLSQISNSCSTEMSGKDTPHGWIITASIKESSCLRKLLMKSSSWVVNLDNYFAFHFFLLVVVTYLVRYTSRAIFQKLVLYSIVLAQCHSFLLEGLNH